MSNICNYTFDHYEWMLTQSLKSFEFSSFSNRPDKKRRIYLRHDIDVSPENALKMARIETSLGIQSTFFVANNSPYYNLMTDTEIEIVQEIKELGHKIGLHVDERAKFISGFQSLNEALDSIFSVLETFIPLTNVISFHMPSLYRFSNHNHIGKFINTYSKEFSGGKVKYLSDSGRHWREGCFCQHLNNAESHSYQVLIHPIWWYEDHVSVIELYKRLQDTKEKGLIVNLRNDIRVFRETFESERPD